MCLQTATFGVGESSLCLSGNPNSLHSSLSGVVDPDYPLKSMCLDVSLFSRDNMLAWISRIQRYFDYYNTPDPQQLLIAFFT